MGLGPIRMNARFRLGCDIGGTFTDFVLFDTHNGELHLEKCLTTPQDPSEGVLNGIAALRQRVPGFLGQVEQVLHGTTLVINAVIERKGAKTGFITTDGFRDILQIGTERRYDVYDLQQQYPEPLVPRRRRIGITERIRSDGAILVPLDRAAIDAVAARFSEEGVESVAICLLHAYRNPVHEEVVEAQLRALMPKLAISTSSKVLPEINEYARASTTVVNAYTQPLMRHYLQDLERRLVELGFGGRILVMLSSGGVTSVETAAEFPVRVIESGPVGGVIMGHHVRKKAGLGSAIAFDMGGTTAKVCLLEGDEPHRASEYEVARVHRFKRGSGIPIKVPCVDLLEIGTGGGSIAKVGPLGLLEVGPQSAGADPGPACYGRGGTKPTVTDADLLLGYLDAAHFLGGTMVLDRDASRRAIINEVAKPLDLDVERAAWGIHELANESMAAAARIYVAERGANAARMVLVATGGAGPVHAYGLAAKLGIGQLIVPPAVGVASAVGFLAAPVSYDLVQTYKMPLPRADLGHLDRLFDELQAQATKTLAKAGSVAVHFERSCDIRYVGQGYEIKVRLPGTPLAGLGKDALAERFRDTYTRSFGNAIAHNEFEIVNVRLIARGPDLGSPLQPRQPKRGGALKGRRSAYCARQAKFVEHAVYDRYALAPGLAIDGPAIFEERESTTIVGTGGRAQADELGLLRIDVAQAGSNAAAGGKVAA